MKELFLRNKAIKNILACTSSKHFKNKTTDLRLGGTVNRTFYDFDIFCFKVVGNSTAVLPRVNPPRYSGQQSLAW